jgi:iron complex transport system substrate-binding protein
MGGISLVPTSSSVDGDTATITYDVLFGDQAAYNDLTGLIDNVDGTWVVPRTEFCSFMASARTPCP